MFTIDMIVIWVGLIRGDCSLFKSSVQTVYWRNLWIWRQNLI